MTIQFLRHWGIKQGHYGVSRKGDVVFIFLRDEYLLKHMSKELCKKREGGRHWRLRPQPNDWRIVVLSLEMVQQQEWPRIYPLSMVS